MLILRTWRSKGVLACTHGFDIRVCLWVENAYPSGIIEVIRQPYKSQLAEMQLLVKALGPIQLAPWDPPPTARGRRRDDQPVRRDAGLHFCSGCRASPTPISPSPSRAICGFNPTT